MSESKLNIIIFSLKGKLISIPAYLVSEILGSTKVTDIPFMEHFVDGLISINGKVVVQIDLAKYFGIKDQSKKGKGYGSRQDGSYELLQLGESFGSYALKIDKIVDNLEIESADIQPFTLGDERDDSDTFIIDGEFEWNGLSVFHINKNPIKDFMGELNIPKSKKVNLTKLQASKEDVHKTQNILVMKLAEEYFGFTLDHVVELFETDRVSGLPGSPEYVSGIAIIRSQPILVVSMRALLGFSESLSEEADTTALLVINFLDSRIALEFDEVVSIEAMEIGKISKANQDSASNVLLSASGNVINMLSGSAIFNEKQKEMLAPCLPNVEFDEEVVEETSKYLQVSFHGEKYIIPCEWILRIIDFVKPNALDENLQAEDKSRISGVVSVDGKILPVLGFGQDAFKNMSPSSNGSYTSYLVLKGEQNEFVSPVDFAEKLVDIEDTKISLYDNNETGMTAGVVRNEGELLNLLDVSNLERAYFQERL